MDTNILFAAVEVSNASHEAAAAFLESADARDDIATLATL
jgi:predicted nucleic acid-binding protein